MKIIGLKCAVIGNNPVVRVVTDQGISGYGQIEAYKPYLRWHVLYYEPFIVGADPTDVERVMQRIRLRGAFKPWGSAASAIEMGFPYDFYENEMVRTIAYGGFRDKIVAA